jgi:hypothetical protein
MNKHSIAIPQARTNRPVARVDLLSKSHLFTFVSSIGIDPPPRAETHDVRVDGAGIGHGYLDDFVTIYCLLDSFQ